MFEELARNNKAEISVHQCDGTWVVFINGMQLPSVEEHKLSTSSSGEAEIILKIMYNKTWLWCAKQKKGEKIMDRQKIEAVLEALDGISKADWKCIKSVIEGSFKKKEREIDDSISLSFSEINATNHSLFG